MSSATVATTEMTETKVGVKPRASSLINDADDEADWNSARRTLNVRWVTVALSHGDGKALRAFFLQVCVVSMHQNGRDTHVRQAKIFGPRTPIDVCAGKHAARFTSVALTQFAVLR